MSEEKKIDKTELKKLLGIKDKTIFSIKNVGNDRYRVNLYEKHYIEGSVIPRLKIVSSHYICNQQNLRDITL